MRIGILGTGSIGQRHIRNLRGLGIDDIYAYDPDHGRLESARKLGATIHASAADVAARRPTALFVCTPPIDHVAGMRLALDVGCDVFVEKPIAVDPAEVDLELERARIGGRLVAVGYNLRYDPGLRQVKALVAQGAIGRILSIRAEFGQYLPDWRPSQDYRTGYNARRSLGGGVILDQSHEIDYVRWIGGEVRSIAAVAERVSDLDIDVEDLASITMSLESGTVAEIHLDSFRRDYARGCVVIGSDGTLVWTLRGGLQMYSAQRTGWSDLAPASDIDRTYADEVKAFLSCVADRRPPEVDGPTGKRVLELALAARQAATSGRRIGVMVPPRPAIA